MESCLHEEADLGPAYAPDNTRLCNEVHGIAVTPSHATNHHKSSPLDPSRISQEMAQAGEDADGDRSLKIRLRSYQQEMLEKSLEGNIIVAMPTGSKYSQTGCLFRLLIVRRRRQDSHCHCPDPSRARTLAAR